MPSPYDLRGLKVGKIKFESAKTRVLRAETFSLQTQLDNLTKALIELKKQISKAKQDTNKD